MASGNSRSRQSYATYRELIGDHTIAALIRESFTKGGLPAFLRAITAREQVAKLSPYEAVVFLPLSGEGEIPCRTREIL